MTINKYLEDIKTKNIKCLICEKTNKLFFAYKYAYSSKFIKVKYEEIDNIENKNFYEFRLYCKTCNFKITQSHIYCTYTLYFENNKYEVQMNCSKVKVKDKDKYKYVIGYEYGPKPIRYDKLGAYDYVFVVDSYDEIHTRKYIKKYLENLCFE